MYIKHEFLSIIILFLKITNNAKSNIVPSNSNFINLNLFQCIYCSNLHSIWHGSHCTVIHYKYKAHLKQHNNLQLDFYIVCAQDNEMSVLCPTFGTDIYFRERTFPAWTNRGGESIPVIYLLATWKKTHLCANVIALWHTNRLYIIFKSNIIGWWPWNIYSR